jgi:hypothetical protein
MKQGLLNRLEDRSVGKLPVVRNFAKVVESRDINYMNRQLYDFLNLHCGFIAHFNIDGFKATYSHPVDFANVFIPHFDPEHRYFNDIWSCDEEPYRDTGFTKAEIKREFFRVVKIHKNAIAERATQTQRDGRYAAYLKLKEEFEADGK